MVQHFENMKNVRPTPKKKNTFFHANVKLHRIPDIHTTMNEYTEGSTLPQ
jgi:hypothetical protein